MQQFAIKDCRVRSKSGRLYWFRLSFAHWLTHAPESESNYKKWIFENAKGPVFWTNGGCYFKLKDDALMTYLNFA